MYNIDIAVVNTQYCILTIITFVPSHRCYETGETSGTECNSVTSLTACDNVTPVTVLQMKYMGQCPKCLGVYRGTVGQTTSSGKVGEHEVCP